MTLDVKRLILRAIEGIELPPDSTLLPKTFPLKAEWKAEILRLETEGNRLMMEGMKMNVARESLWLQIRQSTGILDRNLTIDIKNDIIIVQE
jgi:hypothetical protein